MFEQNLPDMRKIFLVIVPALVIASCTPVTTTICSSASGTEVCYDGRTYHFDDMFWEKVSNHVEIQLEPNPSAPGEYCAIYFFLYGTTIQTDTVPHVGTYTSIPFGSSSTGTLDFSGFFQTISGTAITSYSYEQDASNTLSVTAFSGNNVSGNGTFKVKNLTTNDVKSTVFSFENIPYQP
jgi:hypothetical protein